MSLRAHAQPANQCQSTSGMLSQGAGALRKCAVGTHGHGGTRLGPAPGYLRVHLQSDEHVDPTRARLGVLLRRGTGRRVGPTCDRACAHIARIARCKHAWTVGCS